MLLSKVGVIKKRWLADAVVFWINLVTPVVLYVSNDLLGCSVSRIEGKTIPYLISSSDNILPSGFSNEHSVDW